MTRSDVPAVSRVEACLPQSFVNWPLRIFGFVLGSMWFLIGVSGLTADTPEWLGIISGLVFGLWWLIRLWWAASVEVGPGGVVTRSIVRTRRYSFDELDRVEAAVGPVNLNPTHRESLVLIRTDGTRIRFPELNNKLHPDGEPSLCREAVESINTWIRHAHGST